VEGLGPGLYSLQSRFTRLVIRISRVTFVIVESFNQLETLTEALVLLSSWAYLVWWRVVRGMEFLWNLVYIARFKIRRIGGAWPGQMPIVGYVSGACRTAISVSDWRCRYLNHFETG
jgi:hypothetical protein